jgi:hypothetical protein
MYKTTKRIKVNLIKRSRVYSIDAATNLTGILSITIDSTYSAYNKPNGYF